MELKREDRARGQTEMVEFIALAFPSSSTLKILSFQVIVVQRRQRNLQKCVMHVHHGPSGVGNAPQTLRPEFPTHAIPEETLLFSESHE